MGRRHLALGLGVAHPRCAQGRAPRGEISAWVALPMCRSNLCVHGAQGLACLGHKPGLHTTWENQALGLPKAHGFVVKTHFSWVLCLDPVLLGPASRPSTLRSCIRTQCSWVRHQGLILMGLALRATFLRFSV